MYDKENINFIFQFDNKGRSTNFFLLFIASFVVFLGLAFYFVATNKTYELIADIVLAIVYFYLFHRVKPSFFELLVTETHLQVNFYSVATAARNYQSIEMPLHQLKDYAIKTTSLGLRKELVLSVESRFGLADYPPVSVSILSKAETGRVRKVLDQIVGNNHRT
jgi:hypothetical protein